jgi:hypothetical protein
MLRPLERTVRGGFRATECVILQNHSHSGTEVFRNYPLPELIPPPRRQCCLPSGGGDGLSGLGMVELRELVRGRQAGEGVRAMARGTGMEPQDDSRVPPRLAGSRGPAGRLSADRRAADGHHGGPAGVPAPWSSSSCSLQDRHCHSAVRASARSPVRRRRAGRSSPGIA